MTLRKKGRPPRAQVLASLQTFVPVDLRETLTRMEVIQDKYRTVWLMEEMDRWVQKPRKIQQIRILRTHPRGEDGWVLFHWKCTPESADSIDRIARTMDVSRAALLYSILAVVVQTENIGKDKDAQGKMSEMQQGNHLYQGEQG